MDWASNKANQPWPPNRKGTHPRGRHHLRVVRPHLLRLFRNQHLLQPKHWGLHWGGPPGPRSHPFPRQPPSSTRRVGGLTKDPAPVWITLEDPSWAGWVPCQDYLGDQHSPCPVSPPSLLPQGLILGAPKATCCCLVWLCNPMECTMPGLLHANFSWASFLETWPATGPPSPHKYLPLSLFPSAILNSSLSFTPTAYWSEILLESESESHSIMSDSLRPHGLYSPWNTPGENTGVDSLSLLQGIFPIQGSNPGLPHCR